MKHIVTSSDGIQFVVNSHERSVAFDRTFASRQPAAVLETHGDFTRVKSLDDLLTPEEIFLPRIAGPAERRAAFRLIRGGKP